MGTRRRWLPWALTPWLAVAILAQDAPATSDLASSRDTLTRWVETQQLISKERREWQAGKEILEERISLVKNETAALEKKIAEAKQGVGSAEGKRHELASQKSTLVDASAALETSIASLEAKTRRMSEAFPQPLHDRIEPLLSRLPARPAKTELSLAERFQNVIGILNEANKFDQDVQVTTEIRQLPDGSTAEVRTLYLGLGQAYYVTADGLNAGIGQPSLDGWQWEAANEIAPRVRQAIGILEDGDVPAFVPLPVKVR